MGSSWPLGGDIVGNAWTAHKNAQQAAWARSALQAGGLGAPQIGADAWQQHNFANQQSWGQSALRSAGLAGDPTPELDKLMDPNFVRNSLWGQQLWQDATTGQLKAPTPKQNPTASAPPSPPPQAQPAPVAVGQTPAQAVPAQTTSNTGAVAKAPPQQPPALEFGYKPNLSGMGGASLDQLSAEDFELQRRRAFLDGTDSMAGMRQVRELLAQRNGYSANEARTMSVAGLEKPKAGSTQGGAVGKWNLTGPKGEAAQAGYDTVGEKNLDQVMNYLQNGGPVAAAKEQEWEAIPGFGGAMAVDGSNLQAGLDLNVNPQAASTQVQIALKHGATIDAPGGAVTEQQSSADGQISDQSPDLNQGGMLQAPSYSEVGVMAPGGADFRALANDWAQSGSGLRGRLENTPLDQVAPWQMKQPPLTLNGDNTREIRMAAFAAAGENDPNRSVSEVLAASPIGTRDGQSVSGATTDLSQLDARKIYGQKNRPTQVRSGVPGFNPGNY